MNLLQSVFYGFISGLTEFIPVSSQGHQTILLYLFGIDSHDPIRDLIIHLSALVALLICCRSVIARYIMEGRIAKRYKKKRNFRNSSIRKNYDLRLIQTAVLPLLAGLLFCGYFAKIVSSPVLVGIAFAVNALLLFIPEYIRRGNKDSKFMTGFDGILMGIFGALSAVPGISRIGAGSTAAMISGADRDHSVGWMLLLSIPALIFLSVLDIYGIASTQIAAVGLTEVIGYSLSGVFSAIGSYLGILFIRFLAVRGSFAGFAWYSLGVTMFTFVLYLIV